MGAQITNLAAARKGPNCIISDCCIHWRERGGSSRDGVEMCKTRWISDQSIFFFATAAQQHWYSERRPCRRMMHVTPVPYGTLFIAMK